MAEYSNTGRVFGKKVGQMADASNRGGPVKPRYMTNEQREQADRDTLKSYETWKAQREARLERMRNYYMARQLRHKDIVM